MYRMISDPFIGQPQGFQIVMQIIYVLFGTLCGWIAFDTRRALVKLVSLTPPSRLRIDPNRVAWIWFYRFVAIIALVGVATTLLSHWFARS